MAALTFRFVALLSVLFAAAPEIALSAEIRILYPTALAPVFRELLPQFERSSGHKVIAQFGPAGAIADRVRKGEAADVAIVTRSQSAALQTEGKIAVGSGVGLAKVGIGLYVAKGGPKPDIASVDSFKRALLAANTIALIDPSTGGASGIYLMALFERLGLASEIRPKLRLFPSGSAIFFAVAKNEVEIGFGQVSEILSHPTVDLIGPLPGEIQNYTHFA